MATSIPTANSIAANIKLQNGQFNGHNQLVDAFLSELPVTVKEQEVNDSYIETLYSDVKRLLFNPSMHTPQPESHWALAVC